MFVYLQFFIGLLIFKLIQFFFSIKKFSNHGELLTKKLLDNFNKTFYMDNNQIAHDYYINSKNGFYYIGDNKFGIKVSRSSAFTFDDTIMGKIIMFFAFLIEYSYVFTFLNDNEAKIDIYLFNFIKVPDFLIIYKMIYDSDTLRWKRESYIPLFNYFIKYKHIYYLIPEKNKNDDAKNNEKYDANINRACYIFT